MQQAYTAKAHLGNTQKQEKTKTYLVYTKKPPIARRLFGIPIGCGIMPQKA
jgi:hypothetical protein